MTRDKHASADGFALYVRHLCRLHELAREGKSESGEADDVRDEMDAPWRQMTEADRKLTATLSEVLYTRPTQTDPLALAPTRLLQRLDELDFKFWLDADLPWRSLFVDYAEPYVERLWIPYRTGRLFLHRIYPCHGQTLWHPHPWPAASKIIAGAYIHTVGIADAKQVTRCVAGSSWDMQDHRLWHSVAPLVPTLSVMVTGPLFPDPIPFSRPAAKQRALTPEKRARLLADFRAHV